MGQTSRWEDLPYTWVLFHAFLRSLPCRIQEQQASKEQRSIRKAEDARLPNQQHNVRRSPKEIPKAVRPLRHHRANVPRQTINLNIRPKPQPPFRPF